MWSRQGGNRLLRVLYLIFHGFSFSFINLIFRRLYLVTVGSKEIHIYIYIIILIPFEESAVK